MSDNVVSLADFRKKQKPAKSFEEVATQNQINQQKIQEERKQKNEQVLRRYKIK